jgi:Domain of unknown function (DUF1992)
MPIHRRDGEGHHQTAHSWESLVERQIREAMDDGAFDDLPYQGRPLPADDDAAAGEWAMAYRMLRNAGAAPPWILADKEARNHLAERDRLFERAPGMRPTERARARKELSQVVDAANRAIDRLNAEAPTDRQHRVRLDPAAEGAALERAFEGGA